MAYLSIQGSDAFSDVNLSSQMCCLPSKSVAVRMHIGSSVAWLYRLPISWADLVGLVDLLGAHYLAKLNLVVHGPQQLDKHSRWP